MGRRRPPSDFDDEDEPRRRRRPLGRAPIYDDDDYDAPPPRRKSLWPLLIIMLLVWGGIFGAIACSHFVSDLPDVRNLLTAPNARDVTILDDHDRLVARRGLMQGA